MGGSDSEWELPTPANSDDEEDDNEEYEEDDSLELDTGRTA